ncbi:hypothetical protein Tco_0807975 [Tanacetum coccineum]
MSKVRQSRSKLVVAKMSTSSSTPASPHMMLLLNFKDTASTSGSGTLPGLEKISLFRTNPNLHDVRASRSFNPEPIRSGFSNVIASGNPTPYFELYCFYCCSNPHPLGTVTFLFNGRSRIVSCSEDDPTSSEVDPNIRS